MTALRFGNGLNGFYAPKPTPEWLAGSPGEQKTVPDVGRRLRGHWLIATRTTGTERCYLCDLKFPETAIDANRIPPCEAGDEP